MAPGRHGAIKDVPPELMAEIRKLRAQGAGKDRIWRELGDRLKPFITGSQLHNWLYSRTSADTTVASADEVKANLGKIADLLERSGIDPEDVGKVERIRLSTWQGITKDAEGEAHVHELEGASVLLSPKWEDGPQWPVVQQAKPTSIRPAKYERRPSPKRTAVVLPDMQIGYRRDPHTFALDPFHDEKALDVALQIVAKLRPHLIVLLGDVLDLPEHSTFEQEPAFALTTQAALDRAHEYLATLRATVPDAEIRYLEGNHDRRLQKSTIANAKASFGLRQAATLPSSWPVLSIPHLLRLDELGVEYVAGYPANITWINDRLACIHGHKVRSAGSTAAAVIDDERVSVLFGHVHRIELQHKTRRTRSGPKFSLAASCGCLSRVDGAVPSTKGSTDPFGRPITNPENWQQALAAVSFVDGDGPFGLELIPIHDGEAIFRGEAIHAQGGAGHEPVP